MITAAAARNAKPVKEPVGRNGGISKETVLGIRQFTFEVSTTVSAASE